MWKNGSLWTFILRRLAKAQGYLDPVSVFSSLQHFSKPSEVWVPTELLRSGAILQARGLVNSQAIQHNLDWVWPFWVKHQFDPQDRAFIPRSFGISHINLTYRNWTALGVPDFTDFPLVDPRGLVTPFWDGWSIDAWIMAENYPSLFPSQSPQVAQAVDCKETFAVSTATKVEHAALQSYARVKIEQGVPTCEIIFSAETLYKAWLIICVRPYNPEGVSFIHDITCLPDTPGWQVNKEKNVYLQSKPSRYIFSTYNLGDISQQIPLYYKNTTHEEGIHCPVGMASGAAVYEIEPLRPKEVCVKIPLTKAKVDITSGWSEHLQGHCQLRIPDKLFQFLYETSLRTLILHSPGDIYPGPFTYKRFWFRDAAFILNAMINVGLLKNVEKIIDRFPSRQTKSGYFMSQDGEWDSNGQVLWVIQRYAACTQKSIKPEWIKSIVRGAQWIQKKRLLPKTNAPHAGLLPAGFSAEHFGPNDYYYWDDFWGVSGLNSAALLMAGHDPALAVQFKSWADDLSQCLEESLELVKIRLNDPAIPASPYRRMDAGAIGILVAAYPLQLYFPRDSRMRATVDFLLKKCFLDGAFYHEISHSGINVYLTLHVAQVLLRDGDPRFFAPIRAVAELATSTGQWPEAIHPQTKGGCMGDGQHIWATAEWVCMVRNMFVREEEEAKTVILCSGIPEEWLEKKETLYFGFTLTMFGKVAVTLSHEEDSIKISWEAQWHGQAPRIEVALPGYPKQTASGGATWVDIPMKEQVKL